MPSAEDRIGFVGVGRMGANMARRLKDEHYAVVAVTDTDRGKASELARELGCEAVDSPAQVAARSSIIFTVVSDDQAMRDIFSPDRPGSLLSQATGRTFINCATLSPHVHVEIHRQIDAAGGQSLEACMASSLPQARQGTLFFLCSGRRAVYDQMAPVLHALGTTVHYVGEAGQAATVKALVNMVMNSNTAALAEGLGLASALGLDVKMVREMFAQTGANSRVLETDGEDMQQRAHDCFFSAAHAAKDSGIAVALAESVGLPVPVASATLEQYRRLIQQGKGELDKSAVSELTFIDRQ